MDNKNNIPEVEKIPFSLSLFVTSCVIALLCLISLAIAKNVEYLANVEDYNSLHKLEDKDFILDRSSIFNN